MNGPIPPSPDLRPGLTPEESRYLDGELPAAEARRLEAALAADPQRAARLERWRTATDLWRDEARRAAGPVDPVALYARVLARVRAVAPGPVQRRLTAYAAAALLLIGLGVGGTLWLRHAPPPAPPAAALALEDLERAEIDLLAGHPDLFPRVARGDRR